MGQKFSSRNAGVAAATLALMAAPASAQTFAASKSDAIIGAPSQLAAIMAAQSTGLAVALANPYRATVAARPAALIDAPRRSLSDLAASPLRPDVFNSIALPISHSPLDARWNRVANAGVGGRAAAFVAGLPQADERSSIEAVNAYVNARVAFTSDSRLFGVDDRWSSANDTLARGRGDCEDYALAKLAMLRRAGIADRNLYFVVLKDVARRADHAVLVVRSEGRFLVLDNGTDRLRDSSELVDYKPVLTFTAGQRFTHGYRRSFAPPVVLASNSIADRRWDRDGLPSSPFAAR
jgi:predicted transglutaminase-like cysteine proteinase